MDRFFSTQIVTQRQWSMGERQIQGRSQQAVVLEQAMSKPLGRQNRQRVGIKMGDIGMKMAVG